MYVHQGELRAAANDASFVHARLVELATRGRLVSPTEFRSLLPVIESVWERLDATQHQD